MPPVKILLVNIGGLSSISRTWTYHMNTKILKILTDIVYLRKNKIIEKCMKCHRTLTSNRLSSRGSKVTFSPSPEISLLVSSDKNV